MNIVKEKETVNYHRLFWKLNATIWIRGGVMPSCHQCCHTHRHSSRQLLKNSLSSSSIRTSLQASKSFSAWRWRWGGSAAFGNLGLEGVDMYQWHFWMSRLVLTLNAWPISSSFPILGGFITSLQLPCNEQHQSEQHSKCLHNIIWRYVYVAFTSKHQAPTSTLACLLYARKDTNICWFSRTRTPIHLLIDRKTGLRGVESSVFHAHLRILAPFESKQWPSYLLMISLQRKSDIILLPYKSKNYFCTKSFHWGGNKCLSHLTGTQLWCVDQGHHHKQCRLSHNERLWWEWPGVQRDRCGACQRKLTATYTGYSFNNLPERTGPKLDWN